MRARRIWPARYPRRYRSGVARYDDDLRFAHVLADNADDITTRRFRALDLRVDTKPDLTPVSDADQAAEESLRNVLRRYLVDEQFMSRTAAGVYWRAGGTVS